MAVKFHIVGQYTQKHSSMHLTVKVRRSLVSVEGEVAFKTIFPQLSSSQQTPPAPTFQYNYKVHYKMKIMLCLICFYCLSSSKRHILLGIQGQGWLCYTDTM